MGHQRGRSSAYSHALIEAYRGQHGPRQAVASCVWHWLGGAAPPTISSAPLVYIHERLCVVYISIFHCICTFLSSVTCGLPVISVWTVTASSLIVALLRNISFL